MEFAIITGSTAFLAADKRCSAIEPDGSRKPLHDNLIKIQQITPVTYIAVGGVVQVGDVFQQILNEEFFNDQKMFKYTCLNEAGVSKLTELCTLAHKEFIDQINDYPLENSSTISLTVIDYSVGPRIAIFDPQNNFKPVFRSHDGAFLVKGAIAPDVFLPEIKRIYEQNYTGDTNVFLRNVFLRAAEIEKAISPTFDLVFLTPAKSVKSNVSTKSRQLLMAFNTSGYVENTLTSRGQLSGYKLVDGSVDSVQIANAAITSAKIQDAAITTAKIDNLAVTNAKIQNVAAEKILAGKITATIQIESPVIIGGRVSGTVVEGCSVVGGAFVNESGTGWISIDQAGGNFADFNFRVDTSSDPLFTIYNNFSGVTLKSFGYDILGTAPGVTYPAETWDCSKAAFSGLKNASGSWYATQDWVNNNFVHK